MSSVLLDPEIKGQTDRSSGLNFPLHKLLIAGDTDFAKVLPCLVFSSEWVMYYHSQSISGRFFVCQFPFKEMTRGMSTGASPSTFCVQFWAFFRVHTDVSPCYTGKENVIGDVVRGLVEKNNCSCVDYHSTDVFGADQVCHPV